MPEILQWALPAPPPSYVLTVIDTDNISPALVLWAHLQERVFLPGNQLLVRDARTGKISEITLQAPPSEQF